MIVLKSQLAPKRGFTLIEILVVLGVIGVLLSLLIPAVQGAREMARRTKCVSNLGQMTLATLAFESTNGGFPSSVYAGRLFVTNDSNVGLFSAQSMLLPYLDQSNLYNKINFSSPSSNLESLKFYNDTVASQTLTVFLCPSDPKIQTGGLAKNSYRGCTGLGQTKLLDSATILPIYDGLFVPLERIGLPPLCLPASAVTDGLSNTLAFSEKPIGSDTPSEGSSFRDYFFRFDPQFTSADKWATGCSDLVDREFQLGAGGSWMIAGAIYTQFYASIPPNSLIPDCGTSGINNGLGIFAARSYHPGGVNAAMADGSVRWFSSSTNVYLWRSLGTRAGGEVQVNN